MTPLGTPPLLLLLMAAMLATWSCCPGCIVGACVVALQRPPVALADTGARLTLADRTNCGPGDPQPPVRVNTTDRVMMLRQEMAARNLTAYLIPSGDEHQSEYVAEADERRWFISGFSGSAGDALITTDQQLLWTDGRYFLQADDELDCDWILMKDGLPGVPSMLNWLQTNMAPGSRVGADSRLLAATTWLQFHHGLTGVDVEMVEVEDNLVDEVWGDDRPPHVADPVFVHHLQFAGRSWQDKVQEVRQRVAAAGAQALVVSALDEVAWLLNLRGADIPYNPMFRGYVVVTASEVHLFIPPDKLTLSVQEHLNANTTTCPDSFCVQVHDYSEVFDYLRNQNAVTLLPGAYSYAHGVSYAVYSAVREERRVQATSPVLMMKARKNEVEAQGMRHAHLKDAVALCAFLAFLEDEIAAGNHWTEMSADAQLREYRARQQDNMGPSFSSISAFGSNGAIIHYEASEATDTTITSDSLYLLDSGGQYQDGTTDVTRTMHYGTPTAKMVEAYTRVLMGQIDLNTVVFPNGTSDTRLDVLARRALYAAGLDYRHGTGHGIGMFLGVHEAPTQVRIYGSEDHPFYDGYFFSNEPGYYEEGEFGIRLENIEEVVVAETEHDFLNEPLAFRTATLVPYENKLIDVTLLSDDQCEWVNAYHKRVWGEVSPVMEQQEGMQQGLVWLREKTAELVCRTSSSVLLTASPLLLLFLLVASLL